MNIRELASQFSAVVLTQDINLGSGLKIGLERAGYEVSFIQDPDLVFPKIQKSAPHVIFFALEFLKQPLNQFVESVIKISPEIALVPIAPEIEFSPLTEYAQFGVMQILTNTVAGMDKRVVWCMDRICETLYLTYQNEDLLEEKKKQESAIVELRSEGARLETQVLQAAQKSGSFRDVQTLIQAYKTAESKEQILNLFFEQLHGFTAIFFKYLPSVRSFLATHSAGLPEEQVQKLNCQLEPSEVVDLHSQVSLGVIPGSLSTLIQRQFSIDKLSVIPLFIQGGLEGLIVTTVVAPTDEHLRISDQFSIFSLAYSHLALEKKIEIVDLQDTVTEVYNLKYYRKRLGEEVARARRLKHPLSVVKVAIDDFEEIEQTLGADVRDHVLKTVASLMVKSSRAHDFVSRLQINELALVLVHCSRKGAGIRADRLRRIVESTSVLDHGVKISISIGMSEYPALCDSAHDLDETSSQALMHIFQKGGNRICLFKASSGYRPEFVVADDAGEG